MFSAIKIYPQNLWIAAALLLPNLIFACFPAINVPADNSRPDEWSIVLILERIGQAAVFILPLFLKISMDGTYKKYALAIVVLCAILYYICWGRFFLQGRLFSLMYTNLWIIPIPMALLPVIYFAAIAMLMDSWLYGCATLIFAAGHLLESWYISSHII